jgi:hypothetical protein
MGWDITAIPVVWVQGFFAWILGVASLEERKYPPDANGILFCKYPSSWLVGATDGRLYTI